MARYKQNQAGFTLLELLIVMSIMGVLSVIAIPKFSNTMSLAHTAKIQADMQVLNSSIMLFQAQTGKYPENLTSDMKEYIMDIDHLKPPLGNCLLRDGTTIEITATAYTLSADRTQAICQSHPLSDFGRKD
jgi:prepilin-type N-terminal cleavage/methylation domain-containing protein